MMMPVSESESVNPKSEKAVRDWLKRILYPSAKEAGTPSGHNMLEAILISSDLAVDIHHPIALDQK
jgi:hypothetical protein